MELCKAEFLIFWVDLHPSAFTATKESSLGPIPFAFRWREDRNRLEETRILKKGRTETTECCVSAFGVGLVGGDGEGEVAALLPVADPSG